jgi:hypothetical protein
MKNSLCKQLFDAYCTNLCNYLCNDLCNDLCDPMAPRKRLPGARSRGWAAVCVVNVDAR